MKAHTFLFVLLCSPVAAAPVPIFDGKSLAGWEGDAKLWRVEDGMITGGSLTEKVPHNDFIATVKSFANFDLRLKIKLSGDPATGMINSGVQIRSLRVPGGHEMSGYQVDYGKGWYGKLYDESRRNKVVGESKNMAAVTAALKEGEWNEYRIRTEGPRIQSWINGVPALDYTEPDPNIAQDGRIGIQVHAGGKALVQVKDVTIEELPPTPNAPTWEKLGGVGAARAKVVPPKKGADAKPAGKRDLSYNAVASAAKTPDEERATFKLPDGFEVELVAAESEGIGKFVPIAFDQHGALWTTTALEYPVDGNENPAAADALYASKARDKVLVFDRDPKAPTGYSPKARVFAEGLALPLGVLPYKKGCYVQHGHDIAFLEDTDGDGKADQRTVILTGFGVQDSHLFPHQFLRAPGGWIWMAQGAFNYSKVRRPDEPAEKAVQFDQTRMAKFRPDGSGFDITSNGPCNIWGLVLNGEGEAFIQEANDFGYPVMPFHEYANYPGCSDRQWKSYAPEFPGTAPDFKMGGTGLSGLALLDAGWVKLLDAAIEKQTLSSRAERSGVEGSHSPAGSGGAEQQRAARESSAPPPPADARDSSTPLRSAQNDSVGKASALSQTVLVANPITNRIQGIKMHRDGPRWRLDPPQDFLVSDDPWFRPVAITIGPDGCLYIVDWYNKIISHNEVPRNHPDRDKTRGRIWRVKAKAQKPFDVPDFTKLSGDELIAKLGGESLAQSHLAWQAIGDRGMKELVPRLREIVSGVAHAPSRAVSGAPAGNPTGASASTETRVKDAANAGTDSPARAPTTTSGARALPDATRIAALWALEALNALTVVPDFPLAELLVAPSRNIRRELARAMSDNAQTIDSGARLNFLWQLLPDSDPEVRFEAIRSYASLLERSDDLGRSAFFNLMEREMGPITEPVASSTRNGKPIKVREAYDREFERYLVRMFLERHSDMVTEYLDLPGATKLSVEARLLASLALEPKASAARVAKLLPQLQRAPGQEEVLRLAQFPVEPGVSEAIKAALANPATSNAFLEALLAVRSRLDAGKLMPILADTARTLLASTEAAKVELGTRLAGAFQLGAAETALVAVVEKGTNEVHDWIKGEPAHRTYLALSPAALQALQALREMRSDKVDLFDRLARLGQQTEVRDEALAALASSRSPKAGESVLKLWPQLEAGARRSMLDRLVSTKPGARAVVAAVKAGTIGRTELDGSAVDKLQAVLGSDPDLAALMPELSALFRPVLTLDGSDDAWVETKLSFDGPLTVETWVRLAPGLSNADGVLGVPGALDLNFFQAKFRVFAGAAIHDAVVAKKPLMPDLWTHIAAVRDAEGRWKLYLDGELDNAGSQPAPGRLENVRIGWTGAKGGTRGALAEFRLWDRARSPEEIRRDCDRSYGAEKPAGLVFYNPGGGAWGKLQKGARVAKTSDLPPILTADEATALDAKYAKYRALAAQPGDAARGKISAALCQACHLMGPTGGNIGPNLSGVGAMGTEAILRNILQPNAAMENGYRIYRVEKTDGSIVDALFVSEDQDAVVIRLPGAADQRIERKDIRSTSYLRRSLMPEGLLETMTGSQASDLFAYLLSLK